MKKIVITAFACTLLLLTAEIGHAQKSGFGVGAIIGGPDGISYKGWIDQRVAIGGAFTVSVGDGRDLIYTHADVLLHSKDLFGRENSFPAVLTFYYGGGIGITYLTRPDDEQVELRAPLGTTYGFDDAPVDIFFELVPSIRIIDSGRFFFNGALGFRYYLN